MGVPHAPELSLIKLLSTTIRLTAIVLIRLILILIMTRRAAAAPVVGHLIDLNVTRSRQLALVLVQLLLRECGPGVARCTWRSPTVGQS